MKKEHELIMLPTTTPSKIYLYKAIERYVLMLCCNDEPNEKCLPNQHLYLLSNEEIKEGDWCYDVTNKSIGQWKHPHTTTTLFYKKIIATTEHLDCTGDRRPSINDIANIDLRLPNFHPLFISYYIEQYNKGNIIKKVMVEYEKIDWNLDEQTGSLLSEDKYELKVDSNNCISYIFIASQKESWSRDEYEAGLRAAFKAGSELVMKMKHGYANSLKEDEWIKQNLN